MAASYKGDGDEGGEGSGGVAANAKRAAKRVNDQRPKKRSAADTLPAREDKGKGRADDASDNDAEREKEMATSMAKFAPGAECDEESD